MTRIRRRTVPRADASTGEGAGGPASESEDVSVRKRLTVDGRILANLNSRGRSKMTDGIKVSREALGDDAAALEAVFAGGLLFGAVIPGGGVFEGGEFEDDDFFDCGTFQDLVATMDGAKFGGMLLKTGRNQLSIFVQLGFIAGFFPGEYDVCGQGILLGVGASFEIPMTKIMARNSI